MKAKITLVAIVALGAPLAQGQVQVQSIQTESAQIRNEVSVDQITLQLTAEQRADLFRVLDMMGAKVGDWKTYSPSLAPSKCTTISPD